MKSKIMLTGLLFTMLFIFSCGDKKSEIQSKNIKVEITTTALTQGDDFLCVIAAAGATGVKDLKVNGVTRSNETALSLTKNDIVNNKLTIETAENAVMLAMSVGGTSDDSPYTITVKPTVKGSSKDATTFTVDADGESRHLTYQ